MYSYILGLSTMFFGMMAVFFYRRHDKLYELVALLMGTLALEYVKDFLFYQSPWVGDPYIAAISTGVDMIAVPMYAYVLLELIKPGSLTFRKACIQELPFVLLLLIFIISRLRPVYYGLIAWSAVYGTYYLIWAAVNIPRYNRILKERYSYTENVNLNWLRTILYTFYVLLSLWIVDCVVVFIATDCLYMMCNMVLWMVISFFLFRHESVMDELSDYSAPAPTKPVELKPDNSLAPKIEELFSRDRIFLNPNLKLSDVARAVGSNRTYVSNYFNRDIASTFYDYVNRCRVEYACTLLADPGLPIQEVAERSGFSSASVFSRIFAKHKGCTPTAFREQFI